MKKILVFGTFDIFHAGHRNFLKQARHYGDFLKVIVAKDETVLRVKKQSPQNKENQRAMAIKNSSLVDEVALGGLGDKYQVVKEYAPDVICLGYDQHFFVEELEKKLKAFGLENTKIIRLEPYKENIYKSSLLRKRL